VGVQGENPGDYAGGFSSPEEVESQAKLLKTACATS
jgi:hypothetical protein